MYCPVESDSVNGALPKVIILLMNLITNHQIFMKQVIKSIFDFEDLSLRELLERCLMKRKITIRVSTLQSDDLQTSSLWNKNN